MGSDRGVSVDVRVVAATNRDLQIVVREGKFREDLFYRLNVLPMTLPPLRDRGSDVALLVHHFLALHAELRGKSAVNVEDAALTALQRYRWPGNVREVENLVERLIVLNESGVIAVGDLPEYIVQNSVPQPTQQPQVALPPTGLDLDGFLESIENGFIHQALQRSRGNKTMAAGLLNLNRTTFIERLRKKGLLHSSRQNGATAGAVAPVTEETPSLTPADAGYWDASGFSLPIPGKLGNAHAE